MIYSEDNYGRFEALAFIILWVGVGAAAMILIMDGAHLIGHGISSLRYVIRPVVVIGGLAWLLPSALSGFREVSEILRYDHSPIPKQLMIAVVLLGMAIGAMAIIAHQIYLLAYFQGLGLPWPAITAPLMSVAVLVSIIFSYAGGAAWFALFPAIR
jgi:hypothetical protein